MAPHSSTLAWKIPWALEPGGLQSNPAPASLLGSPVLHISIPQPQQVPFSFLGISGLFILRVGEKVHSGFSITSYVTSIHDYQVGMVGDRQKAKKEAILCSWNIERIMYQNWRHATSIQKFLKTKVISKYKTGS